jgi:hypothetical protein
MSVLPVGLALYPDSSETTRLHLLEVLEEGDGWMGGDGRASA